jgi:hypothetical protein
MVIGKLFKFLKKRGSKSKNKKKIAKIKPLKKKNPAKKVNKKIRIVQKKSAEKKEKLIADAVHYYSKIKVAVLKLKGPLKVDEKINIRGFTTNFKQTVSSMQIDHDPIKEAKKGQEIGVKVVGKVRHGDKVYKIQ